MHVSNQQPLYERGSTVILIWGNQGPETIHRAGKWQSQDTNSGRLMSKPVFLITIFSLVQECLLNEWINAYWKPALILCHDWLEKIRVKLFKKGRKIKLLLGLLKNETEKPTLTHFVNAMLTNQTELLMWGIFVE